MLRIKSSVNRGFTVLEAVVVMAISSFLILGVSNGFTNFYSDYMYKDYANKMESLVKYAKIAALKNGTYIGVCIDETNKTVELKKLGSIINNTDPCDSSYSSKEIIKTLKIERNNLTVDNGNDGFIFDARGMAYKQGSCCISNGGSYMKYKVGLAGISSSTGEGNCP